jgi:hypothetical protein
MAKLAPAPSASPSIKRDVALRWTKKLAEPGFTPVVNYFLHNYHRLNPPITTPEAMFVVHLMSFKWDQSMPRPAFLTIATRMGISTTMARNHARTLENGKKYLIRIMRIGQPNYFDLTPLFRALEKLLAEDERRQALPGP